MTACRLAFIAIKCFAAGCLLLPVVFACSRSGQEQDGTVPRQVAYPRLKLYDTLYVDAGLPAGFVVNAGTSVKDVTPEEKKEPEAPRWIDISYPAYGAVMHCSFIPVDKSSVEAVAANRYERMMMNLGDNFAEQTEISSKGGYYTLILITSGQTMTPVQFLSSGHDWVINGALMFDGEIQSVDSVMPVLEAVRQDMIYASRLLE